MMMGSYYIKPKIQGMNIIHIYSIFREPYISVELET